MSMYLFDEQPILANKTLAREIGLNEALVLQQINYWIEINKRSGNNYFEGRYWTYNSIRAWQENDFDYMSIDTVKRTFSKLEKMGYLIVGNFNKDPRDKTKWYTINDEKLEELYLDIKNRKLKKEKEIIEKKANSTLPNALDENAPMHYGNMPQPLPEITTKNSTEITSDISSNTSFHPPIYDTDEKVIRDGMVDGNRKIKSYKTCLEELRESSGYNEHYSIGNLSVAKSYDEILKVLADVMVLDPNDTVTINQLKMPAYVVQERFKELNEFHMEYLVDTIRNNQSKIRNVRAFILTAAYNALSDMEAHYTALVSYDMKEGY
ncbi:DUF6017 domain-containing protein [Peptacetobacter sp.]|uniref:DUF6017 domain-containing protein n=1 Tax=Peptacetobacter sp. TaxID=2991975 RepID=UPI002619781B|nr:DUF6017 domain-containing protein [Peptacetobacter sp.]